MKSLQCRALAPCPRSAWRFAIDLENIQAAPPQLDWTRCAPRHVVAGISGLYQHLERANQAVGRLDGLTTLLPDTKFFLYLYIRKGGTVVVPDRGGHNRRFLISCF
jgi:hypothetical protein